jgi:hypothetical protein
MSAHPVEATLAELMAEKRPDGTPRFRREAIRDVIALILLSEKKRVQWPKEALQLLGEFSIAAQVPLSAAGHLQPALDAYFAKHPVDPELFTRLQHALKNS